MRQRIVHNVDEKVARESKQRARKQHVSLPTLKEHLAAMPAPTPREPANAFDREADLGREVEL